MNVSSVLQGLVALLWLGVIGLIVFTVFQASRAKNVKALSSAILATAIAAVLLTTVSAGLVFVQPQERGVVISALSPNGYREDILQPGLRWIIPYFESVVTYPISRQTYTMSIAALEGQIEGDDSVYARTADGQEILLDASVIFAADPSKIIRLHIDWQKRYVEELIRPLARGIIRDAVAHFGVQEVYSSKRAEMAQEIEEDLSRKFTENGLILTDFVLRNVTFSPEYAASVEQKQIAEQQAQQAKFVVDQRRQEAEQARQVAQGQADAIVINAEGEADARIIQAQAEAEALQLVGDVLAQNLDLLTYRYIEEITPGIQVMLLPSDNPFLLPLPTMVPGANPSPETESEP